MLVFTFRSETLLLVREASVTSFQDHEEAAYQVTKTRSKVSIQDNTSESYVDARTRPAAMRVRTMMSLSRRRNRHIAVEP